MSVIKMTAGYTYNGVTFTNGVSYQVRARDAEAIIAANKATKGPAKSQKKT